jgi:hypothetical protein
MVLIALSGATSQLWSKDFADMTFRELFIYRATVDSAPAAEREAFQLEWEKQLQSMTEVEREQVEMFERQKNFPNPYVQGRGYDNQGTNSGIFAEDIKDQQVETGEDKQ